MCHDLPYAMFNYYHACAKGYFRKQNLAGLSNGKGWMTPVPRSRAIMGFKILVSRTPSTHKAYNVDIYIRQANKHGKVQVVFFCFPFFCPEPAH